MFTRKELNEIISHNKPLFMLNKIEKLNKKKFLHLWEIIELAPIHVMNKCHLLTYRPETNSFYIFNIKGEVEKIRGNNSEAWNRYKKEVFKI
jgi:hypothetical protein